jgi:hypothetical protein
MQVFFDEKTFVLDDYLTLTAHGIGKADMQLKIQDKGHRAELVAFVGAACGGTRFPIPWDELLETWDISHHADRLCRFSN